MGGVDFLPFATSLVGIGVCQCTYHFHRNPGTGCLSLELVFLLLDPGYLDVCLPSNYLGSTLKHFGHLFHQLVHL